MAEVLKVEAKARIKATRDGVVLVDHPYNPSETDYTELASARIVLATNMASPQEFNMAGVSTAANLIVKSDRPILVGVNTTLILVQIGTSTKGGAMMISGGSFTHLYFQNESTTNLATVQVLVTD